MSERRREPHRLGMVPSGETRLSPWARSGRGSRAALRRAARTLVAALGLAIVVTGCGGGAGESVAVVSHLLPLAGPPVPGSPPACALADDTRPARGCPPIVIMPVEKRLAADARPLERGISLEPSFVGRNCLVERMFKDSGSAAWKTLPPVVVRAAPPTVSVSFPVSEKLGEHSLDLWVQARLMPPVEQSFETQPVAVPSGAVLRGAIGVERVGEASGAPVEFRLIGRTPTREVVLLEQAVGGSDSGSSGWSDYRVDLGPLAGESVRFAFSSRALPPPGSASEDVRFPLWATPRIVAPVRRARRPNVILVSLDTLRADHLGVYGCDLPTTPLLDHLATEGTLFEHALTTYPSTTVAHMSMLTGLYPVAHGVIGPLKALHPAIPTLAELLLAQGYETAAVTEDGMISVASGFARGFTYYREFKGATPADTAGHVADVVNVGLGWIAEHREAPFFVFLHTYQVHGPYTPPPEFDLFKTYRKDGQERPITPETPEEIRSRYLYAGEVRYTDSEIGRLLEGLAKLGEAERTVVIVTADHGESFRYRDGLLGHGWTVYEDVMRVPLIVRAPGLVPAGRRVPPPVSLVDVVPTVLDLAGVPIPSSLDGQSLVPLMRDDGAPAFGDRPVYGEVRVGGRRLVAAQLGPRKWIMDAINGGGRVYLPAEDPAEDHDLATPELLTEGGNLLARYEHLKEQIAQRLGLTTPGAAVPDQRTTDKLKALGYVH